MLTSIVIASYNKLEYTRLCVESIRTYTSPGTYEIIVVDNGSTDGSALWLQQQPDIRFVGNAHNNGFTAATNQGMKLASGDTIMLLNNDTIVTSNWLERMLSTLYSDERIGAVGCVTNNCSYYQTVPASYTDMKAMFAFADEFNRSSPRTQEERLKLIAFCMAVKSSVVSLVGLLDERFSPGNYEDDDYSYRIRKAGFKLMLCTDTFIHHFGSTSWKDNSDSFHSLLTTNRRKFLDKWGYVSDTAYDIRFHPVEMIRKPRNVPIRVLDMSCRGGGTLLHVRNRFPNAELFGIESNRFEADCSALCADVQTADPLQALKRYPDRFFDVILLPDGLQNSESLTPLLKAAGQAAKTDGQLIGKFANSKHYSILRRLIARTAASDDRFAFALEELIARLNAAGFMELTVRGSEHPLQLDDLAAIGHLAALGGRDKAEYAILDYVVSARSADAAYCSVRYIAAQQDVAWHLSELALCPTERLTALIESKSGDPAAMLQLLGASYAAHDVVERALALYDRASELNADCDTRGTLAERMDALRIAAVREIQEECERSRVCRAVQVESNEAPGRDVRLQELNEVVFTGERLVINKNVKHQFAQVMEEHLARYELAAKFAQGKDVLDAACGTGYGTVILKQAGANRVIGLDVSEECIRQARINYAMDSVEFVTGDVHRIDAKDKTFGLVVSFETIEHIPDGAVWIAESARVLKDDGLFIVSTPNRYVTNPGTYYGEQTLNPHHKFEYSAAEFIGELLVHYDIVEIYGQSIAYDDANLFGHVMRQARQLDLNTAVAKPAVSKITDLQPLSRIKDGQPMYHVAVCRKKPVLRHDDKDDRFIFAHSLND